MFRSLKGSFPDVVDKEGEPRSRSGSSWPTGLPFLPTHPASLARPAGPLPRLATKRASAFSENAKPTWRSLTLPPSGRPSVARSVGEWEKEVCETAGSAAILYVLCLRAAMPLARSPVGPISFLSLSLSLSLSPPKLNLNCLTYTVRPRCGMGCLLARPSLLPPLLRGRPAVRPGRGQAEDEETERETRSPTDGRTDGRTRPSARGKCLDSQSSTAHYFYGPSVHPSMQRLRRQQ